MAQVQNTQRIVGMFSGLDTDGLVRAITMNQQNKVDLLSSKMQKAEWKKDLLTDFNNKLRVFRDTYGSVLSEKTLMTKSAFMSYSVKMSENSGVGIVALSSAAAGRYSVKVDQIATAAAMQGNKITNRTTGLTETEVTTYSVGYLSTELNTSFPPGGAGAAIRFSINDKSFEFSSNDSLKKIMDEVNKSGAGVTMSYSQTSDRVAVTSNTTGAASAIAFTDESGFLSALGLNSVAAGQDAVVYLNGETTARHFDTNVITLDGIQMSFLRPTAGFVDYALEADHKPAVGNIKAMVDAFNELFKELSSAYNQKINRDYKPLTEEQRGQMTEKEIEQWEEKAKEGLLYRDITLNRLLNDMRGALTKSFGGFGSLASIGITTTRYTPGEPTQLELDESKLAAALQEDPDRVFGLMSGAASKDGSFEGGLLTQLNKMMDDYVGAVKGRDLQTLNNDINNYSKSIKEQEKKLIDMSEKYYLQYAKLETMLSQMQAQQDTMAMMFGWNNNGQ